MHDGHMSGWMMLIGGIFCVLVLIVLVLAIVALLKYLGSGPK